MEEYSTTVHLSGFVLSSLMFQHLNSDSDEEGFFIGESVGEEKSKITDSQTDHIHFVHTIQIQRHITCRRIHRFYNTACEVDKKVMREILSNFNEENVIGWYRQRRNMSQQMTLKEQLVHQNLRKVLPHQGLIFLLLTSSAATPSGSTHRLEYTAFKWDGRQYISVPISISNLGMMDQQDYWKVSATCPIFSHCQAVKKYRTKFFYLDDDLREVAKVSEMNDALLDEMKNVCGKVEKTERLVEKLQADIAELRVAIDGQKKKQQECDANEKSSVNEAKENMLLCAALKAVFPNTPSLRTQTLTAQGFPVLELCCSTDHGIDIPTRLPLVLKQERGYKRKAHRLKERCQPLCSQSKEVKVKKQTVCVNDAFLESESDTEGGMTSPNDSNSPAF